MYAFCDGWAELAAGDILLEPTGDVIVVSRPGGVDWTMPIKAALENRGAELPVCGFSIGASTFGASRKQAFATREEAEAGIRLMTETAASFGRPAPDFRIIEAATIGDAMPQVTGFPFPGP